jgi:hypothetical protein
MLPMRGWFVRAEAVNEAVERHAELNAAKLARSGCNERHLFMLVEPVSMEAWSGLMERKPPKVAPRLPDAVTTAWAPATGATAARSCGGRGDQVVGTCCCSTTCS